MSDLERAGERGRVRADRFSAVQFDSPWDAAAAASKSGRRRRRNEVWLPATRKRCFLIFCTVHF